MRQKNFAVTKKGNNGRIAREVARTPASPICLSFKYNRLMMPAVKKRILRAAVKVVATAAGIVFLFDNKLNSTTGITALLGSLAVLLICLFIWLNFDLGEDKGFWPDKPE